MWCGGPYCLAARQKCPTSRTPKIRPPPQNLICTECNSLIGFSGLWQFIREEGIFRWMTECDFFFFFSVTDTFKTHWHILLPGSLLFFEVNFFLPYILKESFKENLRVYNPKLLTFKVRCHILKIKHSSGTISSGIKNKM